jgi:hypothetical protein
MFDRCREEGRVEHLKRDIGAGDAHAVQFTHLAIRATARHDAKGFSKIVRDWLKIHRPSVSRIAVERNGRFCYPRKVEFITP